MAQINFDDILSILVRDFHLDEVSAKEFLHEIWGDSDKNIDLETLRTRTSSALQDFILDSKENRSS